MLEATLLENVDRKRQRCYREEAFGPVAILSKFADFEQALDEVNDQQVRPAGRHLHPRPLQGARRVGPARGRRRRRSTTCRRYRVDNMPYGGVKDSGLGREGVRFAIEDMTEIRNLVIRRRDAGPPLKAIGE